MKKHIVSVLFLSLFVLLSVSSAQGWEKGFGWHKDGPKEKGFRMFEKLNLTQEQKNRTLERFRELARQTLPYKQKNETLGMNLSAEMKKDNPDRKTVMDIIRDIYGNKTVIAQKRIGTIIDIRSGLTAEQKQKLNETGFRFKGR